MLSHDALLLHFRIVGLIMAALVVVNIAVPRHLHWRRELSRVSLVNRQIFEVHAIFLVLLLAMFSALFLLLGPALLEPSPLSRALLGGLTVFWGLRMVMQWCYYSSAIWRGDRVRTVLHYVFSVTWVYVTVVCGVALGTVTDSVGRAESVTVPVFKNCDSRGGFCAVDANAATNPGAAAADSRTRESVTVPVFKNCDSRGGFCARYAEAANVGGGLWSTAGS